MSGTLNKVMLIGHLGDVIKMHHFEGGGCIGRIPMATNESYTRKSDGEKVTETEWHNLVVRNKSAETFEKYTNKGDKIYIEGKIKTRKWQAEDGTDRYSTEIHVFNFTFLTPKGQGSQSSQSAVDQYHAQQQSPGPTPQQDDDDLPF